MRPVLRNEALKQLAEVVDELRYQLRQPSDARETDVMVEYMDALLQVYDEYLGYVPPQQLDAARLAMGVLKKET